MVLKTYAKKLVLGILKRLLIWTHRLLGPPHILSYSLDINEAMLKAFGAHVGKRAQVYPPVTLHNIRQGYGNLTIGDHCVVHGNTYLDLTSPLTLEPGVSLGGVGDAQFPVTTLAVIFGGGVRVGLEDNIWLDPARTRLACNADLLRRTHAVAAMANRKIMAPAKLRELLQLGKGFGQYGRTHGR